MASLAALVRRLRCLAEPPAAPLATDAALLHRFAATGDEAAFELLVRRHGPLVWSACRRVLGPGPDAEDAFQATFLILARRAGGLRSARALAGWLHRVATRAALRTRSRAVERHRGEPLTADAPARPGTVDPATAAMARELDRALAEEIDGLPARCREPLVLCLVAGHSYTEAARRIGCPAGTVSTRLARARELLQTRLSRRGFAPAAALALLGAGAAPAATLIEATTRAALAFAAGPVEGAAAVLAVGVLRSWRLARLKVAAAALAALGLCGAGAGMAARQPAPAAPSPPAAAPAPADPVLASYPIGKPDVHSVTFSPDGRWLATFGVMGVINPDGLGVTQRRMIHVREIGTARVDPFVSQAVQPANQFGAVAFSPDSQTLAIAQDNGTVQLIHRFMDLQHDAAKTKNLFLRHPGGPVRGPLAFAPDGATLAAVLHDGSAAGAEVALFDVATQRLVRRWPPLPSFIHNLAFSPDGTVLAVTGPDAGSPGGGLTLWRVADGRQLPAARLPHPTWAYGLTFSPDGRTVAVGYGHMWQPSDYSIRLWEVTTGRVRAELRGHRDRVNALAFTPDGRTLVAAGRENTLRLWDVANGRELGPPVGGGKPHWTLAMAPDGRRLASADDDGHARLWDLTRVLPPAPPRAELRTDDLAARWNDLADADAARAWRAVLDLAATPAATAFLAERLHAAVGLQPTAAERERINSLIAELDDDRFAVRQWASAELAKLDAEARPLLDEALAGPLSPEARQRVAAARDQLREAAPTSARLRALRAVEALERMATPAARRALDDVARAAVPAWLARDTAASARRLARTMRD